MSKFIEVTPINGSPELINTDDIIRVQKSKSQTGSYILFKNIPPMDVVQLYSDLKKLLEQ